MRDIKADGTDKELVFPNAILAMLHYPDLEVRELTFRIYNEYIAEIQARYPDSFYPVGLINWWDQSGAGTRKSLDELKSLGLKTFLLPLSAGKDASDERIDYTSRKMIPVWEAIEASGVPVSHHIGEVAAHPAEVNMMAIGFLHSAGSFRDMFGRYIFGGILDRHPGLQVGWFEGGISWVPGAMQDAEHVHACYAHLNNVKIKHEPNYYWRNHMCASFILDPLGLEMIDRLGADKLMWSSDYPHNESSFGYSRNAINQIVRTVGPERAKAICGDNVARFLKM
jgi:predicted TIM-barrel fold metal-dependent hydrolase